MQERLVRFGFSGLLFLGSTVFFSWYFGVDISRLLDVPNDKEVTSLLTAPLIIGIITLVIGTPAIGFCLSSISASVFLKCWSRKGFYRIVGDYDQQYYKLLRETFGENIVGLEYSEESDKYNVADKCKNSVYICHDVMFRKLADLESLKYTARRLDMFWTHLNNLSCIVWATFFAILIAFINGGYQGDISLPKALMIVPFLAYGVAGYVVAARDLRDSTEFEKIYLLKHDKVGSLGADKQTPKDSKSRI